MDNNENAKKGYQITSSKHISEVIRGDTIIADKAIVVATSDAYMTKTSNGKEWNVSVWDGGTVVTTTAKVDIRTGEVTDIIKADIEGLQTCEREYIIMNDTQVEVYTDMHGYTYWADLKNEI